MTSTATFERGEAVEALVCGQWWAGTYVSTSAAVRGQHLVKRSSSVTLRVPSRRIRKRTKAQ